MIVAEYLVKKSNWLFVQTALTKQVLTLKAKSHCANRTSSCTTAFCVLRALSFFRQDSCLLWLKVTSNIMRSWCWLHPREKKNYPSVFPLSTLSLLPQKREKNPKPTIYIYEYFITRICFKTTLQYRTKSYSQADFTYSLNLVSS